MGSYKTKKSKAAKLKAVESAIPKDLSDLNGSIEAMSIIHHLLQTGCFQARYLDQLVKSMAFMRILHEQTVEIALKHPNADMIPDLKIELDKRKAEKDGKTEETGNAPAATVQSIGGDSPAHQIQQ